MGGFCVTHTVVTLGNICQEYLFWFLFILLFHYEGLYEVEFLKFSFLTSSVALRFYRLVILREVQRQLGFFSPHISCGFVRSPSRTHPSLCGSTCTCRAVREGGSDPELALFVETARIPVLSSCNVCKSVFTHL